MHNLQYAESGSQRVLIQPQMAISKSNPEFDVKLTHNLNNWEYYQDVELVNNPTKANPRIIISVDQSQLPEESGHYTGQLREIVAREAVWGEIADTWANWALLWSAKNHPSGAKVVNIISERKTYISGSDREYLDRERYTSDYEGYDSFYYQVSTGSINYYTPTDQTQQTTYYTVDSGSTIQHIVKGEPIKMFTYRPDSLVGNFLITEAGLLITTEDGKVIELEPTAVEHLEDTSGITTEDGLYLCTEDGQRILIG